MLLQVKKLWFFFFLCSILKLPVNCNTPESAKVSCTLLYFLLYFCCMMLGSKSILLPTDTHELLRCYATFAILKTFGFTDFLRKSLHPHVFAGSKLKSLIVQARTAFGAFDPGIKMFQYDSLTLSLYCTYCKTRNEISLEEWIAACDWNDDDNSHRHSCTFLWH